MENNFLYKTRVSLINIDVFLLFIIDVLTWFIHPILGLAFLFLFVLWIINIIGMRMYVYEDRIEYKVGFILKTSTKVMPLRNISVINYSSDLIGKIFNYGDIVIGTYDSRDSINVKGVKNAKMLTENIKLLMLKENKR